MTELENLTQSHDKQITLLTANLQHLTDTTDHISEKLDTISDSVQKQELLFEKLVNLETKTEDRIKRIHQRIDICEDNFKGVKEKQDKTGCNALKLNQTEDKHRDTRINNLEAKLEIVIAKMNDLSNKVTKLSIYGSVAIAIVYFLSKYIDFGKLF
jgi:chromosome segregation ATPase